jgi:hypothetical protein
MTQLLQSGFLKGSQEIILEDRGFVRVKFRRNLASSEYSLPLNQFNADPTQVKAVPKQWVIGSILFALPIALVAVGAVAFGWNFGLIVALVIFLPLFLIAVYKLLKESSNILIFHHRHSRQSLLVLWNQRPNREKFDSFVAEFKKQIASHAAKEDSKSMERSMVVELKELHSLLDSGILCQEEYEAGKRRILGVGEPVGVIGFHR